MSPFDEPLHYGQILENADIGAFRANRHDGVLLAANLALARMFGYSSVEELMRDARNREYRWFVDEQAAKTIMRKIKASATPATHEIAMYRRNGTTFWADLRAAPVKGRDEWIEGMVLDVSTRREMETALRQSELKYRSLLNSSQNGIVVFNRRRVLYANQVFAEALGFRPDEMAGAELERLVESEDWPQFLALFAIPDMREGEAREFIVRMHQKEEAGRRHLSVKASPIGYGGEAAYLGTTYDITELRRSEEALRDYARRLRLLSRQVLEVQENERRHLARELHDEIGQQLTMIKLNLEALQKTWPTEKPPAALLETVKAISGLMQEVRGLSLDLRPSMLDDLGLCAALRWYAGRTANLGNLELDLRLPTEFPRLESELETTFFRIAQEAVTNVLRHAGATRLMLHLLETETGYEMTVQDDGKGFDTSRATHRAEKGQSAGVLGMQERASLVGADLDIDSISGKGTTVRLYLPKGWATRSA